MSKGKIGVIVSPADREKAQPILDALRQKGFEGVEYAAAGNVRAVLIFLSAAFAADEAAQGRFFAADSAGREIIPVDLDGARQSELVSSSLIAKNAIAASGRSAEEVAERVASAEALQKKKFPLTMLLIAAAAVLILGAAAWIWRSTQSGGSGSDPGETDILQPYDFGMTQEDLDKIRDVVIVGDKIGFFTDADWVQYGGWPGWDYFTYLDEWNDVHWYSVEDGHEFGMQHYDDLRVLSLMPNLHYLTLVLVETDAEMLPDLSGAKYLDTVYIQSCGIDSLEWLAGSPVLNLSVRFTPIKDFGPLTECERLLELGVDMFGTDVESDFSAFAPPRLTNLWMWHANAGGTIDLSAMENCKKLLSVSLGDLPTEDLSFLRGASALRELSLDQLDNIRSLGELEGLPLSKLTVQFCGALRDISVLSKVSSLVYLKIQGCDSLRDLGAIAHCDALKEFELNDYRGTLDASFLASMPKLKSIRIGGTTLRNVDFLEGYPDNRRLELLLDAEVEDLSGLRFVKNYDTLRFSPRSNTNTHGSLARICPYLEGAVVRDLEIYNCTDVELDRLPTVTTELSICNSDLDSLEKMPAWNISRLWLENLQYLTSLDGVEHLNAFSSGFRLALEVSDCPRLEDWSAVENTELNRMRLQGLYFLPRFETIGLNRLELVGIPDLEDLQIFGAMEDGRRIEQLLLREQEDLRDISALRRLKIDELSIPPQVEEQAQELVESGAVRSYEVLYPDGGWSPDESEVRLLSLDELNTLPKALLRRVRTLCVAGDRVVDTERYEFRDDWDHLLGGDIPGILLVDRESGEEIRVPNGKITDLGVFSDLTGLEWLCVYAEPLQSLDGIQSIEGLKGLTVENCAKLTDASAAFAVQGLEELSLNNTKISSIQGVQNLERLRWLDIDGTDVRDLSPLKDCDFSYSYEQSGPGLGVGNLRLEDLSPLASVRRFYWLNINGYQASLWLDLLDGCEIRCICIHNSGLEQEQLERFLSAHGELELLEISYNPQLRDLTPLLEFENLREVVVSENMKAAIASLEGKELPFELEIR